MPPDRKPSSEVEGAKLEPAAPEDLPVIVTPLHPKVLPGPSSDSVWNKLPDKIRRRIIRPENLFSGAGSDPRSPPFRGG